MDSLSVCLAQTNPVTSIIYLELKLSHNLAKSTVILPLYTTLPYFALHITENRIPLPQASCHKSIMQNIKQLFEF